MASRNRPHVMVGLGDAFTAAAATGLLRGHDLERINDFANAVAGYVCSQPGATPEIPPSLRIARDHTGTRQLHILFPRQQFNVGVSWP